MNFDDGGGGADVTLDVARATPGMVRATLTVRGVPRTADVPVSQLVALAKWIEDVWNDDPPCGVPALGLELRFSHREHIGEIYYDVLVDGVRVRSVYEQGGTSNTFRARGLRAEVAACDT